MATSRTSIIRGPGAVKFGAVTLYDADGINAEIDSATQEVPSSISGPLDTIKTDQTGSVTLTPCGQLSADILAALFPHQTPQIGASLCGAADTPLLVHSLAGTKVTFLNAFLSGVPELLLSPVKTAFGQAAFTALLANGKAPGDENAFYKVESGAYNLGYPDPEGLTGVHYTGTFGPLSIPDTADGWTVNVELGTERGASLRGESDLVIAGAGGLTVTLKNAKIVTGPLAWGNTTLRAGEIGFIAQRAFSQGTAGALYTVALTPSGS